MDAFLLIFALLNLDGRVYTNAQFVPSCEEALVEEKINEQFPLIKQAGLQGLLYTYCEPFNAEAGSLVE